PFEWIVDDKPFPKAPKQDVRAIHGDKQNSDEKRHVLSRDAFSHTASIRATVWRRWNRSPYNRAAFASRHSRRRRSAIIFAAASRLLSISSVPTATRLLSAPQNGSLT